VPRFRDERVASRVPGLLLIGTIGSGKTALGAEIGDSSAESGVPTAVIDLDWLGWLTSKTHSGDVIHRLIVDNLAKVWPNFKALGAHRLVLMRTLGSRSEADDICAAVPDVELKIVRLAVSRDTVVKRLEKRDTGSTLNTHLQESLDFARALESDPFEDLLVDAERPLDELARFVMQEVGWL
jgi:hypothetical protein